MGRKVSDGKAVNVTFPAGQVINDYDFYRVGGWNIAAIGALDATETDRTRAGECDPAAVYSVKLPAALNPAAGDKLYWAVNDAATFQRGDTNLAAAGAAGQLPCCHVLKTKNAAGYAQIRIEQS